MYIYRSTYLDNFIAGWISSTGALKSSSSKGVAALHRFNVVLLEMLNVQTTLFKTAVKGRNDFGTEKGAAVQDTSKKSFKSYEVSRELKERARRLYGASLRYVLDTVMCSTLGAAGGL